MNFFVDLIYHHQGELSFDEDEFIVVFDFNDPDWWHGMSNGIVGYFPASYVHEDFEMRYFCFFFSSFFFPLFSQSSPSHLVNFLTFLF